MNGWRSIAEFLALQRNTALLLVALVLAGTGEKLWLGFAPKYLQTLWASILVIGVFGIRQLADIIMAGAAAVSFSTRDMSVLFVSFGVRALFSLANIYLLTVSMRILGLLYVSKKEKLGWF